MNRLQESESGTAGEASRPEGGSGSWTKCAAAVNRADENRNVATLAETQDLNIADQAARE